MAQAHAVRTTRPGSMAHAIAEVVAQANRATGRPLILSEIEDYFVRHTGDALPPAFTSRVRSLARQGVLVAVAGRTSRTAFAHHDAVPELRGSIVETESPRDDDVVAVLRACTAAAQQHGRAVSTAEVSAALTALGLLLTSDDVNAVRRALSTLSRTRRRGVDAWREPRVRRTTMRTTGGRPSARWWPCALALPEQTSIGSVATRAPDAAASRSDIVRDSVARCVAAVGRPISRRELRWWATVDAPVDGRPTLRLSTLARDLEEVSQSDQRATGGQPTALRIVRCHGDLTAYGGAPTRFRVGPTDAIGILAITLEDAALGVRLADEIDAIARLRVLAARRDRPVLASLAGERSRELRRALEGLLGDATAPEINAALARLHASYDRLADYVAAGSHSADQRRILLAELRERQRHTAMIPACITGAEAMRAAREKNRGRRANGPSAWRLLAVTPDTLSPVFHAACMDLGTSIPWPKLLAGVRRAPPSQPEARPRPGGAGTPTVYVDRVDALLALVRRVPVARAHALLASADGLLGCVLRCAAPLRDVLHGASHDPSSRRASLLALGLLGGIDDYDLARGMGPEPLDAAAVALAVGLNAPAHAAARIASLTSLALHHHGPAEVRRVFETAALRASRGRLLSLVG